MLLYYFNYIIIAFIFPRIILNILQTPIVYEHAYARKKMSKMYTDEARKAITQLATGG